MFLIIWFLLFIGTALIFEYPKKEIRPGYHLLYINSRDSEITVLDSSECPFQWGPIPWLQHIQHTESGYEFMYTFYVNGSVYAEAKTEGYVVPAKCGAAYE